MNTFEDRLRHAIESSGLSLRQFAREIGFSPAGLSGLLSGRSSQPSGLFLQAVKLRFQISPEWLETGTGSMHVSAFTLQDDQEKSLIIEFRKLEAPAKEVLLTVMDGLTSRQTHQLVADSKRRYKGRS